MHRVTVDRLVEIIPRTCVRGSNTPSSRALHAEGSGISLPDSHASNPPPPFPLSPTPFTEASEFVGGERRVQNQCVDASTGSSESDFPTHPTCRSREGDQGVAEFAPRSAAGATSFFSSFFLLFPLWWWIRSSLVGSCWFLFYFLGDFCSGFYGRAGGDPQSNWL